MSSKLGTFEVGDRVRVVRLDSAYTGCRGSVVDIPGARDSQTTPLGCYVAIDGENGLSRPFLSHELQALVAVKARRRSASGVRARKANE